LGVKLGLEIQGLDFSNPLKPNTVDLIQSLLIENQFLSFPNQDLTPERLFEISELFGKPEVSPIWSGMSENPAIIRAVKEAGGADPLLCDPQTFGSFYKRPSKFVFAYYADNSVNADIICASMTEAWKALSKPIQDFLAPLTAIHSASSVYAPCRKNAGLYGGENGSQLEYSDAIYQTSEHPVVHTHPDTGLRSLFINQAHTQSIKGLGEAESRAILNFLWAHCARPEFSCRIVCYAKNFVIWDNRVATIMLTEYEQMKDRLLYLIATRNEESLNPSPIWPTTPEVFT
jgi:taurine dioxygenase